MAQIPESFKARWCGNPVGSKYKKRLKLSDKSFSKPLLDGVTSSIMVGDSRILLHIPITHRLPKDFPSGLEEESPNSKVKVYSFNCKSLYTWLLEKGIATLPLKDLHIQYGAHVQWANAVLKEWGVSGL
jgi:hypothetical protein